ncbi:helix-turn-helix domain-containing protein [Lacticaseibacillus mingshuiensis]|uniref:Helix-turn-helix domain-containing protein n=1 Tax=Lacticaseibacillus mingshuiensis TaxID=2799574 RepID=A0ABW4CJ29_9LACO|nr:helix-turn-helix domain-containing protein [Lacticaseibacillus mingshuiensis]
MQVQANLTMTPELKSELRNMVHEEVAGMIQSQQATPRVPDYLNLGDSANYLNVSRGTLAKYIKEGMIHVNLIGTAKRIKRVDLEKFMESKTV